MLVLAPAVCCIAAVALSELMDMLTGSLKAFFEGVKAPALDKQGSANLALEGKEDAAAAAVVAATPSKGEAPATRPPPTYHVTAAPSWAPQPAPHPPCGMATAPGPAAQGSR
jgi:hypothetical protein